MTDGKPAVIDADWVNWWKPSEAQVQWQAAFVERKRKQFVAQARAGGFPELAKCLIPPEYEFDVDIVDPDPTWEEVAAMRDAAAGPVERLPVPDGDWSMFEDDSDDDRESIEMFKWLDKRFPSGWDWVYWLDPTTTDGTSFLAQLRSEYPAVADHFSCEDDSCT